MQGTTRVLSINELESYAQPNFYLILFLQKVQ